MSTTTKALEAATADSTAYIKQVDKISQDMADVNMFAKFVKSADEAARGAV